MITPSFSPTATERVLPKLALDFTTASLDPRITFTRTTGASNPATYVNSAGLIASATNNQPRFDYSTTSVGTCNGLLIEESRTNLIIYSEDMSNGAWKYNAPLALSATDVVVAPTGAQSADRLSTTNAGSVYQDVAITGTNTHTISLFVHTSSTCTNMTIVGFYRATSGSNFQLSINPSTGAIISSTETTRGVQNYGNGWYRFWVSKAGSSALDTSLRMQLYDNVGTSNTLVVWGAQVEVGAFPTSYIPTTTTALTRNADVATMTGTNFSSWFNATEGAIEVEYSQYATGGTVLNASDGTSSNFINIFTSGANQKASCNVFVSGVNNGRLDSGGTFVANSNGKAVYSLIANNRALAYGGNAPSTSASPASMPVVDRLYIGSAYDGASGYNNGYIRKLAYYKQHIINAETQAFSK